MADSYESYSKDELIRLLRERDRRRAFGLVWERDRIEHDRSVNGDFVGLELDAALSQGEPPFDNLIIEGDNFDALRALRMSHAGRVKCIYIDPPYNTGNRDFIYNDRFVDRDDSYRHSQWLEFMYRRLELARELLAEDGSIWVSIDDNEVFHLALLMDQVFGERNRVATCIWQKAYAPKNSALHFSDDHEYVLVYALDRDVWRPNPMPRTAAQDKSYKNPDDDPRGLWKSSDLSARNPYSLGTYPITCPSGRVIPGPPEGRYWVVSEQKFRELDADNRIWWGKNGNNVPAFKRFLTEVKQGVVPQTLWKYEEVGHTQDAKKELLDVLQFADSAAVFSTPKPVRLMERILRIATNPGDLVLDFFAGSGTTAQALLKLNAEDGGARRFILVSNTEATADQPDKNLCRDVCAERVRRVMTGYTNRKGEPVPGLGGRFAYLRARRLPAETVFRDIRHDQVWLALQLIHGDRLTPFDPATEIQRLDLGTTRLLYVTAINDTTPVAVQAALDGAAQVIIHAWQSALLRQHLNDPRLIFEPIPAALINRFSTEMNR
ncbi:site-specific DNA-methyltransferase [Allochromatium tepidum]|uniref:site-specific DNA-methyltransferase (adenine-specific) n=1 Tax=Allochromatium tepidum TaxID=553982 RepID=A0ABM7QQ74_9GAMM|nr:site-specific DNA-methyltransferase [Allochromatium tepidum]BCU07866.1 site-specific DNA-methyltransferase [Allochromatium tepidum]